MAVLFQYHTVLKWFIVDDSLYSPLNVNFWWSNSSNSNYNVVNPSKKPSPKSKVVWVLQTIPQILNSSLVSPHSRHVQIWIKNWWTANTRAFDDPDGDQTHQGCHKVLEATSCGSTLNWCATSEISVNGFGFVGKIEGKPMGFSSFSHQHGGFL